MGCLTAGFGMGPGVTTPLLTPETVCLNRLRDKLAYLVVIVHMKHYTTCLSLTCFLLCAFCFNVQHKQEREICSLGGEARREAKLSRTLVRRR